MGWVAVLIWVGTATFKLKLNLRGERENDFDHDIGVAADVSLGGGDAGAKSGIHACHR